MPLSAAAWRGMSPTNVENIKWVNPAELTPSDKNPNQHPQEQIERLAEIIRYQGFRSPIVVSTRTNHIVVGHGRLEAAKLLGLNQVPVSFQHFDDWDQEYAHMIADNAVSQWAKLDLAQINAEIPELGPIDINLLGLRDFEIEPMDKFDEPKEKSEPQDKESSLIKCPNCGVLIDG